MDYIGGMSRSLTSAWPGQWEVQVGDPGGVEKQDWVFVLLPLSLQGHL